MHLLGAGPEVTEHALEDIYAYPVALDRPFVQVSFVASADGAASVAGRSRGLSNPADRKILVLGRDLADVVLVGAGTALAENYRGIKRTDRRLARRTRLGLSPVPPVAVVSGRCSIEPDSPLVTDTHVPPIILTTTNAPPARRTALTEAGADVVLAGTDRVDLGTSLAALADRGLLRVCCEGGPTLFADLIAAGLVDQLCLTVAPLLAGAGAARIATGRGAETPTGLRLESVLADDGFLMLRYRRAAG